MPVEAHHHREVITRVMGSTRLPTSQRASKNRRKHGTFAGRAFWHGKCIGVCHGVPGPIRKESFDAARAQRPI